MQLSPHLAVVFASGLALAGCLFFSSTGKLCAQGERVSAADPRYKVTDVRPADQWKERYELGPGDVLNLRLHGMPELTKPGVVVGPDGTLSYLQARRVSVTGLTVSELKEKLDKELAEFYRNPNVMVSPVQLGSKRYTILGQVTRNGTFTLSQPITLLEGLAKAGGVRLGGNVGETGGLVDFKSSMIVRNGKVLDVDLAGLYLNGDLTQNIQLEAGDYIYLAPKELNEVYVFGSVGRPGRIGYQHGLTVTGAVAAASGYSQRAWKKRVLLVRGSLAQPETTVVDSGDVLRGKGVDVQVQPGDIVYVSDRPWVFAEDVANVAIRSFVRGIAVEVADEAAVSIGLDNN